MSVRENPLVVVRSIFEKEAHCRASFVFHISLSKSLAITGILSSSVIAKAHSKTVNQ
jgi:hypothetical protein